MPISARHAALRAATRTDHADLDASVAGCFESREGYLAYLAGMHRFHRRLDRAVAGRGLLARPDFEIGTRAAWLAADLATLGQAPSSAERVADPALPSIADEDGQRGVLYVLAGATLGARVLVRFVAALGFRDGSGATCLAAMARSDAWPRALGELAAAPAGADAAMIDAARATFRSVGEHIASVTGS